MDYGKVAPTFWTGDTGHTLRKLGHHVQLVGLYLLTCHNRRMTGLYYLPLPTLSHETGLDAGAVRSALEGLAEADFAKYDAEAEIVWVREMARFQLGERLQPGDKRRLGLPALLAPYARHTFYHEFMARYAEAFGLEDTKAPSKPLPSPSEGVESPPYNPPLSNSNRNSSSSRIPPLTPPRGSEEGGTTAEVPRGKPADDSAHGPPGQAAASGHGPSANDLLTAWNSVPQFVHARGLAGKRLRWFQARSKDPDWSAHWREALGKAAETPFCRGDNASGWRGTIDWFLRPETVTKILEGFYDHGPRNGNGPGAKSIMDRLREL